MSKFNTSGQVIYSDLHPAPHARVRLYDLDGVDSSGLHDEILDVTTDLQGRFSGRTSTDWNDTEGSTIFGNLPDIPRFEFLVRVDGKPHRGPYLAANGSSVPIVLPWPRPASKGSAGSPSVQTAVALKKGDVEDAVKLLKEIGDFLGPFAKAALEGRWSLAQATVSVGNGSVKVPYGVKLRLTSQTARTMMAQNVMKEAFESFSAAMSALAALSPEFAVLAASAGIVPSASVTALATTPVVAAIAALLLAFIVLMLIYGTAILLQLSINEAIGNFNDGVVYIEHPTFALAVLKGVSLGLIPAELVPPIVTG